MKIRPFQKDDFPTYQSWFQDRWLNAALGPIDEEWLAHILQEDSGAQYILEDKNGEMLSVIGVVWGNEANPANVISDLAVQPDLRRQGIGAATIQLLLEHLNQHSYSKWITYVDKNNPRAKDFMLGLGWKLEDDTDMYQFSFSL